MLLASWQDTYFLLFLFISYLLFYSSKYRVGLAVLTYGLLWQYHWSILLEFLYLLIYIYIFIFNKLKVDLQIQKLILIRQDVKSNQKDNYCLFISSFNKFNTKYILTNLMDIKN